MRWNYLSIPKLQRLQRWSLGMDKLFHLTLYNECNYLSMLGLKSIHVSERGCCFLWHFAAARVIIAVGQTASHSRCIFMRHHDTIVNLGSPPAIIYLNFNSFVPERSGCYLECRIFKSSEFHVKLPSIEYHRTAFSTGYHGIRIGTKIRHAISMWFQ